MAVQAGQGPLAGLSKCDLDELHWLYAVPTEHQSDEQYEREQALMRSAWCPREVTLLHAVCDDAYELRVAKGANP